MNNTINRLAILLCWLVVPSSAMALNAVGIAEDAVKGIVKMHAPVANAQRISPTILAKIESVGGKSLGVRATKLISTHGASATRVLGNNPQLIPALERFGFRDQSKILNALSRKPDLANAVGKYGSSVLKLELRSRGQALPIINAFGKDGVNIAGKLTDRQLGILIGATGKFSNASPKVVKEFLDMVGKYTGRVFAFFEKHPRVLYTTAAAGVQYKKVHHLCQQW